MDKWLRNSNVVRVLALLLGILLFLVVHMDDQQTPSSRVPETATSTEIDDVSIEPVNLDDAKYALVSMEPEHVRLRITGRPSALSRINPLHAKVQLDLSEATKGEQTMRLAAVGFPDGLRVEIIPDRVTVVLEEIVNKEMAVEIEVQGTPLKGLVAGTPIVQPNRVFVRTPKSRADSVARIVGIVNVEGATETVSKQVKLVAYNKNSEIVEAEITPSVVEVDIPITLPSKTMPLQIPLTGSPAPGFSLASVWQSVQEVTVYGNQEYLNSLEFYNGPEIDLTGLAESRNLTLQIPLRGDVVSVEPSTVTVSINLIGAQRRTFEGLPISVSGLPDEYELTFLDPADGVMDVTLEGAPDLLNELQPEDIDIVLDVGNLPTGEHQVKLAFGLPSYVQVVQDQPATVRVRISEAAQPAGGEASGGGGNSPTGESGGGAGNPGNSNEDSGSRTDKERSADSGNVP